MSQNTPICSKTIKSVTDQVKNTTPLSVIEAIAIQIMRRDGARERIEREGIVVRDLKGSVIPHPAIKIEQEAIKLAADLIFKYKSNIAR